jgi:PKD repeat protein
VGALAHSQGRRPLPRALLLIVLLAALAALMVGYRPSLSPPSVQARNIGFGVAHAEVLVDTNTSQVVGITPAAVDNGKFTAQLAVSYALYLQSQSATATLGREVGLRGLSVAASGPFTLLLGRENFGAKRPTPPNPILVDRHYRLLLDVDGERPMLTIYAQAPTESAARWLVDAARTLLLRHVRAQQPPRLEEEETVVLRALGPITGGFVGRGAHWQAMLLVFALVLLLGASLLYARRSGRLVAARARATAATLDRLDDEQPHEDVWPHTTRVLPWALAGFLAMLFLIPFDAVNLPIKLPLSSTLDRPLLVMLAALWLLSLAILSGEARPRVKLTRVHFAALAFLGVCCLGVAFDGSALASMDEISLVLKKLALLFSYILFFFVVASVIRPKEVPRYAALMVVLGVIVAIAAVVEYRMHYNVFYSLWGKLLPITVPSDLDAPDSIGRLTVYGPTGQPLELAALLAMVLPFAVMGSVDAATRRRRALYSIAIGLLLAGGLATSRKTSIVAPVGAILLLVAYRPRTITRSLLSLALILGVLVHFTSPGALGSVLTQLEPGHFNNVLSTTDRTARYDAVRPDLLSHLLFGRGYESYDPHKYRILDNEYLGLLITTGILGLLSYLGIFATMMTAAHRTVRGSDPRRASLALASLGAVGVIVIASGLFDVLSFPHVPYLLFFVGAMIIALRERSSKTHKSTRASSALPHQMPTKRATPNPKAARVVVGLLVLLIASFALILVGRPSGASAAEVSCPNANPIVNENNCMGEGTTENQSAIENYSEDLGAFTPQTSYNLGESVPIKIGTDEPSFPATNVNIDIYRIGYYGGKGARLIPGAGATNVKVGNSFQCNPANTTTGEVSCSNWSVSYTVAGNKLPVSGIYEAVITDVADGGIENYVVFPVRNDARTSDVLYVMPSADYEAYNTWGCKSLYYDACGGANTIAGDGRAVAVSFDRPEHEGDQQYNHFFGPDDITVAWLEQQGYDVSYTSDVNLDSNGGTLLNHKVDLVSGHSEYWSHNEFTNFKAARDAGVSVLSLSANTAYWQTRYENNHRTLVCYKTIQGSSNGNPGGTPNDPASVGPSGESLSQFATTTRRDPGAPAGDPNAPPGGRIGPNEPENSLFGVLYVGDNDSERFKLAIPTGNANGEFASNKAWRNAGISTTTTTTLPEGIVGWEWDQVPTQPGYLAQQPAGVKKLTLTNVANPEDSWLQDAGRARANTPPPGEPSTVSAVEYRAPSGALVFASGTMEWAYDFDVERPIDQVTYNILSEMGAKPVTPGEDIIPDSSTPQPPRPSFTATPSSVFIGQNVAFNASASTDPGGTITDYKWDFDNSGKFATDTGATSTTTHAFAQPGTYNVTLKVTDNKGQQETTQRTVNVANTATAKLSAMMNPVGAGQADTLSAAGSSSEGGTITDYKWDLDGNGTYETDTGTTPTVSKTFATVGTFTVGLQVTDSHAATATASLSVKSLAQGVSRYSDAGSAIPSLLHYYRLDESLGATIADSKGTAPGTLTSTTLGVPGAVNGDSNTAASFPGDGDPAEGEPGSFGAIPMNLSSLNTITVEFWLKWNSYGNNDALAMELTSNYNESLGGFIVDPNAGEFGGTFGVGIGAGGARNSVFFARPSAGVWHHYALVLNSAAPAATQITPYVDGQQVSYQKESSGTGAGSFASSTLYLMSRGGNSLFGTGSLDELAIYGGELNASTIQEEFNSNGPEPRPVASFTSSPSLPHAGQSTTLNGSGSHYSGGSIVKYEWDLNGDGTYETNTGSTPSTSTSFANPGTYNVGLRVTDSDKAIGTATKQISVGNFPPAAKVKVTPSPALSGQSVTVDAGESTDQGTITNYKWDLDDSGNFATDTGTTPSVTTSFQSVGSHTVGVRLTDSQGLTTTTTVNVLVLEQGVSDYEDQVLGTPGLIDYYKLGEHTGPTISDSKGSSNGTISGGTFGLPGAVSEDPTTAIGFNGTSDSGTILLNLSSTGKLTVEFWLKWNQYANNDALAMEFTPNFNANAGGFLVDPNAGEFGGTFGIGIGSEGDRNSIFFQRPSAGAWHHYAIVIDTSAPSGSEITPYVDGLPVSFQQEGAATGQGTFANSTLYLMSRAGSALFGAGTLDQLAIYNQPLGAGAVFQHFNSYGTNTPPHASFTVSQNPVRPGQSVTLDASSSTDSGGNILDYQWDLNGDGIYETDGGSNPVLTTSISTAGTYNVGLRLVDNHNASATASHSLTVGNLPPVVHATVSPDPVIVGQSTTLDASGSTDQGAITDYKWDLDNSGNFATDTGTTPSVTTSFQTPGTQTVGVEATNDHGLSARTTVTVTVLEQAASGYSEAVLGTAGLLDYYKLGEPQGPTVFDSKGLSPGTITSGTFGLPGPIQQGTAVSFNGSSDSGAIPLDLSSTSKLTIEFWLKWNQYANNDALAMEFTPNFNENAGGFLVDPNAGEFGGTFGVGVGTGANRNSVFFQRPSAGVWHHYAIVIDTTAAGASEITPYVDAQPVSTQQESSATAQGPFANSTLYLMSRAGTSLFGNGSLDELAVYNQTLSPTTVFAHYHSRDVNLALVPSFTANPTQAVTGQNVTFDASASTDSQGTITDYRWDLDGSGNYATDTGSNSTVVHAFNTAGTYVIGLRATDSDGAIAKMTRTLTVTVAPPSTPVLTLSGASGSTFLAGTTAYTNPQAGNSGGFTVAASTSDSLSGIREVVFPTLTGFSSGGGVDTGLPYQTTYSWSGAGAGASGTQPVTATNNAGVNASANFTVAPDTSTPAGGALNINGTAATAGGSTSYNVTGGYPIAIRTDYSETQSSSQSGLRSSTLTIATASLAGNVCGTFGAPTTIVGSPAQSEPGGCYRYTLTGVDNVGNQTSISTTVIVDTTVPTTPSLTFSGLSSNTFYKSSTNALYFKPSAGGTLTVTASSSDPQTGIRGYTFSPLASNGFGETQTGGQVAYTFGATATQPVSAPTVFAASNAGGSSANATYSLIADSTGPTGGALSVNGIAATAGGSTSFNTSGNFSIGTRADYSADAGSGFVSSVLTRAAGTLAAGTCSAFGTPVTITGAPGQTGLAAGCYRYTLTGTDRVGNTAALTSTVEVDKTAPIVNLSAPTLANGPVTVTFSATDSGSGVNSAAGQLRRATATLTLSTGTCSSFAAFTNVGSTGLGSPFTDNTATTGHCYEYEYTVPDKAGNSATSVPATVKLNTTKPSLTAIADTTPGSTAGKPQVGDAITLTFSDQIDATTIPSSVTLTYARAIIGATTVAASTIGSGNWSAGDTSSSHYSNVGGTSAVVTASTTVNGSTVKLTVTAVSDPSNNLTAGGPFAVSGTVNASVKDVYGNTASTSSFSTAGVRLF